MQHSVLFVWIVASIGISVIFIFIYRRSRAIPSDITYDVINRKRFRMFYGTIVVLLVAYFIAVSGAPYPENTAPEMIIGVKAKMFQFELSQDSVSMGALVEFRVTTEDVTHGFGVYDSLGLILGQVQVMPKYMSRLRMRFPHPGRYPILCLEYCGPLHHQMQSTIVVR